MLQLTLILGSLHSQAKKSTEKILGTQKLPEYSNRALWAQSLTQENQGKKFFKQNLIIAFVKKFPPWTVFWTRISWHLIWRWMLWKQKLIYLVKVSTGHDSICYKSFLAFATFCTYNYCTFSPYRIIYLRAGRGGWACTRPRIFPAFTF